MEPLTKEEREFIYKVMNKIGVDGVDANRLKVDVMEKMDVEPKKPEEKEEK